MEAAIQKGRKLPDWYVDEPPHGPNDAFWLQSFWNLNTERQYEHGPIPWGRIVDYGVRRGLADDIIDPFVAVVRAMDAGFTEWSAEQIKRERDQKLGQMGNKTVRK